MMVKILKKSFIVLILITTFMLIYSIFYPNIVIINSEAALGSEYVPEVKCYNLFSDLSNELVVVSDVNTDKVGVQLVKCKIKYLFYDINKTFRIKVIDDEKPIIILKGENPALVCPNNDYEEEGFTATDNYDGDITNKVTINKIENSIWYTVKDNSGNTSKIERKINFEDKEEPIITLKGSDSITIYLGNLYKEEGFSASDNCDGDITNKVISTGNVDINKTGTYTLTYEVVDSSGNKSTVHRNVIVKNKPIYNGNGVIYLTFDDGPSYLTKEILDILDETNVKATFFVTSANEYTKRAYNNGHTIGLHTYTHNYSYVYANSENYFSDLNNISNNVYDVIGVRPKIIRFPGGSSNTVSRNYNSGIMSYLTKEVINRGYVYFDWNVDSNDAGSDIHNSNQIYYNVINNLSYSKANVVLMHDSSGHTATAIALRDIIKYGKTNGYTFKAINYDTPPIRHSVNN